MDQQNYSMKTVQENLFLSKYYVTYVGNSVWRFESTSPVFIKPWLTGDLKVPHLSLLSRVLANWLKPCILSSLCCLNNHRFSVQSIKHISSRPKRIVFFLRFYVSVLLKKVYHSLIVPGLTTLCSTNLPLFRS